jgi:EAL domain-containing protein (putative c-di-GMP-specific phosphodiesterase class I)
MYKAKDEGRNTHQFYTKELTTKAYKRILLEHHLSQAIDKNELFLVYQPQIDLHTGRVIGAEALLRWQRGTQGLISPVDFIPLAEDSGLIHPIGKWVLETACRQGKQWMEEGIEFGRIAVNIAGPQIQRGGLPQHVKRVLEESGLPAHKLELEVTEGFIMQHASSAIEQLKEIRELGVVLAIDDFGTGYSSLSYLKTLPIHKLKIDKSFVRDIPDDSDDVAIANAIIALGKSLGLTLIAEGVETAEQAILLKESGCIEAQGYYYSRPIKVEEFPNTLHQLSQQYAH